MKNAIAYYYNLYSYDIHQNNDTYRFTINNNFYVLTPCGRDELTQIYELYETLLKSGIPLHYIIPNTSNNLYTTINNIDYVLLQVYNEYDKKISLQDITNFSTLVSNIILENKIRQDWALLWGNKIDYFEYQVNQFGKKYPIIRESFSYYTGLAETGISLYRVVNNISAKQTVCHKRISTNSTMYDLYNPLNLVIDYKVRDTAEYFKDLFINEEDILESIISYFNWDYLTGYDCLIFFNRMFYPSFYFDEYERIIAGLDEEEKIKKILQKTEKYEMLLRNIYNYLSYNINMPDIEWIKKV